MPKSPEEETIHLSSRKCGLGQVYIRKYSLIFNAMQDSLLVCESGDGSD